MDDLDYLRRRESEERERAQVATLDCERRIHRQLADVYAHRIEVTASEPDSVAELVHD